MIKLKTKIGSSDLELEFQDQKELFKRGAVFTCFPSKCSLCGSEDLGLLYRNPKEYEYYGVTCKKCEASVNFGMYKKGGFFIKGDFEKFNGNSSSTSAKSKEEDNDDMPF